MRGFTIPLFFVWLAFLMPVQLRAQEAEGSELDAVKKELAELREEVNELREERDLDTYRNERKIDSFLSRIRIYGDVGLRLHHVWSDGSRVLPNGGKDLVFRPEYRVRLGATGYVREDADRKHRIKYNIRISTKGLSEFDAPLGTPTEAWAPFDGFGSNAGIVLDRYLIQDDYKDWMRVGAGKFSHPFRGSDLVFDPDFGLTGLLWTLDLGHLFGAYNSRDKQIDMDDWRDYELEGGTLSRLHLITASYVLGQNGAGLPADIPGGNIAHGVSAQLAAKLRVRATDTAFVIAFGAHYIEGEEGFARNVGTGTTATTTNVTDLNGNVLSEFRILEAYGEAIFFEQRVASLRLFGHTVYNIASADDKTNEPLGVAMGFSWGALELSAASEFTIGYTYWYVEPDAIIPQMNHEVVNSNYRGHQFSIQVMLTRDIVAYLNYFYGSRVKNDVGGVGRDIDGKAGASSDDNESRLHLGITLRF